jgi:hypothetical protein
MIYSKWHSSLLVNTNFYQITNELDEAKRAYELSLNDPNYDGRFRCILHCMRGRSRSAAVAIAYLMRHNSWSLRESYTHVKERRGAIGPHRHLKTQLMQIERHFGKEPSMSLEQWLELQGKYNASIKHCEYY